MEKQASSVLVYKRGNSYVCDVRGCFGGGFSGAHAGKTAQEAALYALAQKSRYIDTNPKGGDMILPQEVSDWIEKQK